MPRPMRKTQDKLSDTGEVQSSWRRAKESSRKQALKKMLINDDRSHYMYENKQKTDNLRVAKDDIYTQLEDISAKNTRILQKPTALLPQFECLGANLKLQNIENRAPGFRPAHSKQKVSAIGTLKY